MNIQELKEQLQEDILTIMDGADPEVLDMLCKVIVVRCNQFESDIK